MRVYDDVFMLCVHEVSSFFRALNSEEIKR